MRIIKKPLKKLILFFFSNRVPLMDKIMRKMYLELVTSRSSGYKTSSLISDVLAD